MVGVQLYFLPVHTRTPLKFGSETLTSVTCARVCVTVSDRLGRTAQGWGETPLSVEWVWPSAAPYSERHKVLLDLCRDLARRWADYDVFGHPLEVGHSFQRDVLQAELEKSRTAGDERLRAPLLAGLLCCSPFDIALYDAYGKLHDRPVFGTLDKEHLSYDLSHYLRPAADASVDFRNRFPGDYLAAKRRESLPAWHLVGGLDPLSEGDLNGNQPKDQHPVLLGDWIRRDGLRCLKIKLRGIDSEWDYQRLLNVGTLAQKTGVTHLTADFNCTVTDPTYVIDILDRLERDAPDIHKSILYIEQPFPYDLENNRIDVRELARLKPLLMDESAHNWELVRLGASLGWTGVALKTCKTLTGALLSHSWARPHGMDLMVQDLTNPMLAQIPHLLLAANIDTLLGVETNSMQFYPSASEIEAKIHPGVYQRRDGRVDLSTIRGPGFGYRIDEIARQLPEPAASFGKVAEPLRGAPPPHIRARSDVKTQ
ncbi:mandelate racemase/muconate lactonizing enzyme family protein [Pirellulimonas nuda]|uniref:mandelate racemase/muconate lactonizing enzyme family protein n=1 Tax=Pirellulimonas nuda TaxID=2528009 RepID=UPI0018D3A926|nr:mandelate racemase/muconate lactonizing enzyme family protein [Pirellulimonas nuda]